MVRSKPCGRCLWAMVSFVSITVFFSDTAYRTWTSLTRSLSWESGTLSYAGYHESRGTGRYGLAWLQGWTVQKPAGCERACRHWVAGTKVPGTRFCRSMCHPGRRSKTSWAASCTMEWSGRWWTHRIVGLRPDCAAENRRRRWAGAAPGRLVGDHRLRLRWAGHAGAARRVDRSRDPQQHQRRVRRGCPAALARSEQREHGRRPAHGFGRGESVRGPGADAVGEETPRPEDQRRQPGGGIA